MGDEPGENKVVEFAYDGWRVIQEREDSIAHVDRSPLPGAYDSYWRHVQNS